MLCALQSAVADGLEGGSEVGVEHPLRAAYYLCLFPCLPFFPFLSCLSRDSLGVGERGYGWVLLVTLLEIFTPACAK